MSLRSLFLLILGAIIVTFIAVNWSAMTAPAHLNLLFAEVPSSLDISPPTVYDIHVIE